MKRAAGLFLCALLAGASLLPAGCGALSGLFATPTPVPPPPPVPPPTPTPTPVPVVAVAAPPEAERFLSSLDTEPYERRETGADAAALAALKLDGQAAAVLYWTGADGEGEAVEALLARGVPAVVFAPEGADVPEDAVCVRAVADAAAQETLEAAIAYPPHDTPVRLFGLFTGRESAACLAWQQGVAEGRVYVKGAYYVSEAEGQTAAQWMAGRLVDYYAGMVVGIYAETAALALGAAEALLAAERADMEIFCADLDDALLELMQAHPQLIAQAYGVDEAEAGRQSASLAARLIRGEEAEEAALTAAPVTPAPTPEPTPEPPPAPEPTAAPEQTAAPSPAGSARP